MSKQVWLLDLPDCCRAAGLTVKLFDGWETRSRSSGGYDDVLGVGYHHDASSSTSNDNNTDAYGWLNAQDKPIGAMRLHRDGVLVIGAAGATNTMGKGGPCPCSKGTVPLDRGNQNLIAIEAANNGVGETWPKVQVDAYVALVGGLCKWYGLDPNRDIFGHFDYVAFSCPSRKIDPAGPAAAPYTDLRGGNSSGSWLLSSFRGHVNKWVAGTPEPPTPIPPTPTPTPNEDEDNMLYLIKLDSNPYLIVVSDGISQRRIKSDEMDELTNALSKGIGPCYHDPTKADRPIIRDINKIPTGSDDFLQMLGIETPESITQPS